MYLCPYLFYRVIIFNPVVYCTVLLFSGVNSYFLSFYVSTVCSIVTLSLTVPLRISFATCGSVKLD